MAGLADRIFAQRKTPAPDDQFNLVSAPDVETTKSALGQGFDRGMRSLKSGVYNFGGTLAEVAGAEEAAKQAYQEAQNQNQLGALESPDVPRMSEVNDFASGARFVAGSIGQGVPYLGPSVGATLGTRLLGGSAAKSFAAGAGANFVPQAGAVQERLRADPVTAAMSPEKRAAIALGEGAVDSVVNEIVPATIVNKSLSKTVTGRPLSNIAGDTSRAMVGEGAAEAGTEFLGQNVQTALNPNRDTSSDAEALKESFVAGGLGVAPFAVAGSTVANTAGRAAGGAEAAAQRSSNWVSSKLNKENTDIDTVLRPQRAPSGVDPDQWLSQDDALRNEAATRMAEYYSTAANVASRTKQAAQAYLSGGRVDDAWQSMTDAHQNEERIQAVRAGVDRFTAAVGRGVQGAKDALAARENAQTPMPDAFDSVLADRLFGMSKLSSEDSDTILEAMPRLTQGVRTWVSNGFSEGGEVRVPDGLTDVFDDPAAAITDAYRLMVRQGLVKADDAKLAEVTDKLAVEAETRKASGSIIEDNLLPTAQNEYQFSGADHERLASELRTMIATGNIDEQALDTLFGPNKEIVLEALSNTTPKLKAGFETTDVAIDEINDVEDMVDDSDPVKQNEITENVKYLGPYTNTEAAIAKSKSDEETLRNANGQDVKRMGLTDALREQYDGRPEAFVQAMVDAVKKYTDAIRPAVEAGKRPEDALNEAITVLRAADASDKTESIDVEPDTLRSVTPGSKNNVWAISPGKNNEYGDITRGALYFERSSTDKETGEIKPILFATSASRLIAHARKAKTSDAKGTIEQAESLYAGIASMLNAQTAEGKAATTGRVGYRMTPQSDITWMKQDERLPDGFVLPNKDIIGSETKARKAKILAENVAELRSWLAKREDQAGTLEEAARIALDSNDTEQISGILAKIDKDKTEQANKPIAVISETKLGKAVEDKETGRFVRPTKTTQRALSEGEEMTEQAIQKENETPRIFDELTNEVVQPAPKPKAKTAEEIEARAKRDEQVKFTLDLLRKGMPAFNAALNKMSDAQKSSMRDVLNKMLSAKTQDNPIWGGNPPKDIEAFGNRARLAMMKLGNNTKNTLGGAVRDKTGLVSTQPKATTKAAIDVTQLEKDLAAFLNDNHFDDKDGNAPPNVEELFKSIEVRIQRALGNMYSEAGRLLTRLESTGTNITDLREELDTISPSDLLRVDGTVDKMIGLYSDVKKLAADINKAQSSLFGAARENAQTSYSEQSAFGSTEPALSKAEQDKIRADVVKRLGPDVAVEFAKQLFSSKSAAKEISGEWQEGILRISIRAQDPSGVAAHESMHEFFDRLTSSDISAAQKVKTILQNAANSAVVVRQLERLLADHPNALKQIDSKTTDHVEERLAYMYQFWQAGTLKIGPTTKSVFQNIADMFRSVIGKLSNDQKAEQILQAFDQGKTPTADTAAQVLAKDIEYRERQAKAALKVLDPVTEKLSRFILSAESSLVNSGNPHLQKILTEFKNPTGVGTLQSLIEAKAQKHAQFTNRLEKALGNVEKVDLDMAIKHLHAGTEPKDKVVLGIYTATKTILAEMETYMREAGVKRYDAEKKSWVPFGHVKNYFPRAYNIAEISKDAEGFVKDLMTHHMKELEAIAKQANEEVANGSKGPDGYASTIAKNMKQTAPIDAEQVATAIASRIINSYGHADLAENEDSIGYSPNARAINKRTLNWIDVSKFSKWMNNDLVDVMTSYIGQGTKRAEQVRRFGNNSEKLKASVDAAFEFEQNRIKEENPAMGKNEVEAEALKKMSGPVKDIMALEGTIGHDINPKLQRIQGTVLVYENLRTLGLSIFSQMIDPLGIMVRGGTMKEAFATYTRGLKEVAASYKGTKIDDRASQIAEFLGTVDSAGFLANFGQAYSSMYLHQKARKWNEAFFKYNGMDGFNRAARIQATQAAISFIKRQKTDPSIHTKRYLDELVLAPDDIVIDANGDLNYEDPKIQIAVKRWVDQAILRPNAAHRPAWMSDPHFVLFSHMKQFSYTFHDTILKRAWLEAKNHGELGPIGVLLAGFVPMMVAADTAKALLLTGQEPYWMHGGLPSMIDHGVRRAGLLGLAQPYADPLMSGHEMSIAGPTVEQAVSVFTQPVETSLVDALPGASVINTIAGPTPDAS